MNGPAMRFAANSCPSFLSTNFGFCKAEGKLFGIKIVDGLENVTENLWKSHKLYIVQGLGDTQKET